MIVYLSIFLALIETVFLFIGLLRLGGRLLKIFDASIVCNFLKTLGAGNSPVKMVLVSYVKTVYIIIYLKMFLAIHNEFC
jgi:hypothetical protein